MTLDLSVIPALDLMGSGIRLNRKEETKSLKCQPDGYKEKFKLKESRCLLKKFLVLHQTPIA